MHEWMIELNGILQSKWPNEMTSIEVHVTSNNGKRWMEWVVYAPDICEHFKTPKELDTFVRGLDHYTVDSVLKSWGLN